MRHTRTAISCLTMLFVSLGLVLASPTSAEAGAGVIHMGSTTVFAGDPAQVEVLFDVTAPVLGFSFGVSHDGGVLTPVAVNQGTAVLAANLNAGPDFFLSELNPVGGPGLYLACILSFSAPADTLPIGNGQQAVTIDYSTSATAAAGSTTVLDVVGTLGNPPAEIIFSIGTGVTTNPATTSGGVTFDVPAPTGTTCTLTDPCLCDFDINWTNGATYTAVEVRVDGVLTETLAGSATSTTLNLGATGSSAVVSVRGVVGALSSTDDSCTADCPLITPAPIPSGFTCSIATSDPVLGCTVDVSWTLEGTYTSLELLIDGVSAAILPGNATTETLSLPTSANLQQICLVGTDECGDPITTNACCDVTCAPGTLYVRGDCNADGGNDIGDPIAVLGILFSGTGPAACDDACDMNDDGQIDISDPIFLLGNLFNSGANPAAPFPGCGVDGTDTDALGCASFPPC